MDGDESGAVPGGCDCLVGGDGEGDDVASSLVKLSFSVILPALPAAQVAHIHSVSL